MAPAHGVRLRRWGLLLGALLALAPAARASPPHVPALRHVVVIVFENEERSAVLGAPEAPTFTALARRYVDLADYDAVAHPSLPNYLALVSGSTHGIVDDCTSCAVTGPTIGTELDRAHRGWGAFAEGYPSSPRFAKKHVPFLYFPGGRRGVHPLAALDVRRLPAYALVVPDLCDDGHDCGIDVADRWLAGFVPPLLRAPRTAVFVVFDEGSSDAGGGGHVAAIVAGTAVRRGVVDREPTSHYGLLRTVEEALGLPPLGAAARASPLAGIWR